MRFAKPCVMVSHSPNLAWRPSWGDASGCQLVPDDSRVTAYGPYQALIACAACSPCSACAGDGADAAGSWCWCSPCASAPPANTKSAAKRAVIVLGMANPKQECAKAAQLRRHHHCGYGLADE